jgi:hypothetical protein
MEQKWAKNGCGLWSDDDEIVQADLGGVLVPFHLFVFTSSTCLHKAVDRSPTTRLQLMQTFNLMKLSFNALQIASNPSSDCGNLWHVNGNFSSSFFFPVFFFFSFLILILGCQMHLFFNKEFHINLIRNIERSCFSLVNTSLDFLMCMIIGRWVSGW